MICWRTFLVSSASENKCGKPRFTALYCFNKGSHSAKELLGERLESNEVIFRNPKYSSKTSTELYRWAMIAGVAKNHISFCSTHARQAFTITRSGYLHNIKAVVHKHVVSTERYAIRLIRRKSKCLVSCDFHCKSGQFLFK